MQFLLFPQNVQDFENCKKKRNSPEQLAELTQKEATETKTPHS